jgi:hypothetical protein
MRVLETTTIKGNFNFFNIRYETSCLLPNQIMICNRPSFHRAKESRQLPIMPEDGVDFLTHDIAHFSRRASKAPSLSQE